ncbi:MAG: aldo/keto reductase [Gammaproteobacteria bacterium RIFCSPHIGHO2_12_FULL_41_20]|nr:MAG: aldo/keto reductase [Gammaproteobacteria bacterium RIFCSPHIGHO2_12_FULL_41_20]
MLKRQLGSTDIEVSIIGLGTVKFGRNQNVHYPHPFQLPSDDEIRTLLADAQTLGINLLDTAPAYGHSEERLGKFLQGQRQQWIIASKAGEDFINGQSYFDFTAANIRHSVERSLKRLQTDYLDIVLIHSDGNDLSIIQKENALNTLTELKKSGKIRAIGMSTKTIAGGILALDHSDAVMVTFNPTASSERDVIRYAHQQQKGILIKKALASGHLNKIAREDAALQAFNFILREPGISSIVIGTVNSEHLRANAEYAKIACLSSSIQQSSCK